MKTSNFKDSVKVNQILPIMQEHFGQSMNLARIKLMALLLHALCVVQTVSLHKLADAMPTAVDKDSNLIRPQRFFARYVLDLDIIARMIFSLIPIKTGLVLSMDRTNWKFGEFNINILMLGITYKGIAFPLIFNLLPKRGNSNWEERKKIMERFIRFSERNVSTALWQTANSSGRNGQDGSTAVAYGITSEYVRTSGLSSPPPLRESVHGGCSMI